MLTALIPFVISTAVSVSASVAVDSAVKMVVPIGIKALPAFGIKLGTAIVGGFVGMKLGNLVEANVNEVINIVNHDDALEVTAQVDN